jgi:hypothetical protein
MEMVLSEEIAMMLSKETPEFCRLANAAMHRAIGTGLTKISKPGYAVVLSTPMWGRCDLPGDEQRAARWLAAAGISMENITGGSSQDLILMSTQEDGSVQIELLTADRKGSFRQVAVNGLSADKFSGCASVAAGAGADGRHYLVLDGWTGISGNNLASVRCSFATALPTTTYIRRTHTSTRRLSYRLTRTSAKSTTPTATTASTEATHATTCSDRWHSSSKPN